jgi:hypothetical protein
MQIKKKERKKRKAQAPVKPQSTIPTFNYYSIKQFSNPSGPTVYNSGALLPPPTLKSWKDSNLRPCA